MFSAKTRGVIIAALGASVLYATGSPMRFYRLMSLFFGVLNEESLQEMGRAIAYGPYVGIILIAVGVIIFVRGMREQSK